MADKDLDNLEQCVTEQERELAQQALAEFNKNNYTSCLQFINKLENRNQDPKVCHNRAVAEYYKSDLKKTDLFRKNLNNIFTMAKMKKDVLDDVEQCVLHYNLAVLLYHQQKYTEALRITERIYKFIEPMEENLARKVCLLLIELHMCTQQQVKALNLISCIENQFIYTDSKTPNEKDAKSSEKGNKEQKTKVLDAATEEFRVKLTRFRARCHVMNNSLKLAKLEIKNVAASEGSNTSTLCLKANLEYIRGNYKNAIKLFNTPPTDHITFKEHGESAAVIFYNNMGILHHSMGKPNLACYYFKQALKENNNLLSALPKSDNNDPLSGQPLHMLGSSKYHEIMYNLGLALLLAGQPLHAFDHLIIAVQRYHRNSRLWLRIAECCIQVHKANNLVDFDFSKVQNSMFERIIGRGKHKKIILKSNLSNDMKYSTDSQSYAVPVATLEFASLCLRNAFLLLPSETMTSPVPLLLLPGGVQPPPPPPRPSLAPSTPLLPQEVSNLRNSVLAASGYVCLCLGDYILALEHAQTLLSQPKISGAHKLLGHLYAAEALVLMDKLTEAIEHLKPENITDISLDISTNDSNENDEKNTKPKHERKWFPNDMATTHALLQYNLAVALTLRKEYEKASQILHTVLRARSSTCKIPIHVIMLLLYIEIQLGHIDSARNYIRQFGIVQ